MKNKHIIGIIIGAAAIAVITGCAALKESGADKDEAVSLSAVPAAVKQTLAQYATEADVKTVALADQDGTKVYEFDLVQGAKKSELTIAPNGKFMGTEEDVEFSTLPSAAQATLTAKAEGGKLVSFEKAVDENHRTLYEGVVDKGGKKTEYAVDADGKIVTTEAVTPGKD
jgi:uncharacterized membrane protein YkoI